MRRLVLLLIFGIIASVYPTATLAQSTCWLTAGEFIDTQTGPGEAPGYIVSVESSGERCWGNVRLLTLPGEIFADRTMSFYSDALEPLMLVPESARLFGCPYGVGDQVDTVVSGADWNSEDQTGEGWIPAEIAVAEPSCRYDVAAYVDGRVKTFNPLHDALRPAELPRLTLADIADQLARAEGRTTCAPGGDVAAYPGEVLDAGIQRAVVTEIHSAFPTASVYLGLPTIGVPAAATAGSTHEQLHPMAMPDTAIYPVRIEAVICTPAEPRKSEQRWAYQFSCYLDRFDTLACESEGGLLID
jgi:hypothetical protein